MRNWTRQERQRQRELIIRHQPWTRSTGPKTVEGKLVCSQNALKHGRRRAQALENRRKVRESFRELKSRIVNASSLSDEVLCKLIEIYDRSHDSGDFRTALRVLEIFQRSILAPPGAV